jgi:hypothetical protein
MPTDRVRAAEALRIACEAKHAEACAELADLLHNHP